MFIPAYRKAGYSKKYYEEYTVDFILHKELQKVAFDELDSKRIPTNKRLYKREYIELISEKKEKPIQSIIL